MKNNSKVIIGILSAFALTLLIVFGLEIYTIRRNTAETSELLAQASESIRREILAQSVRSIQNTEKKKIESFESIVVSSENLVPVIENIESAGQALGLTTKIVSVEQADEEGGDRPDRISIVVEVSGPWNGTFAFLRALESLPYRVGFEEASYTKFNEGWRSQIALTLFSFD